MLQFICPIHILNASAVDFKVGHANIVLAMLAKVLSCAVVGLKGAVVEVEVEVDISPGLPDTPAQEAREHNDYRLVVHRTVKVVFVNMPTRHLEFLEDTFHGPHH